MSRFQVSTENKRKGEKYVGNSTNVSVLQDSLRCVERTRSQSGRGERYNSCHGSSTCGTSNSRGWHHHNSSSRQSQFIESRIRRTSRHENNRGESSTQTVIVVPVVLTVLFLAVHLVILGHASHVAQVAAQRGAQVAAVSNGSINGFQQATQLSRNVVSELGGTLGSSPVIHRSEKTVGVTVHLVTQELVPFLPNSVYRTVWVAKEEFIREQDR